jgi:nucleotidyltransferase substrate binding protein (TIGR01987 family)
MGITDIRWIQRFSNYKKALQQLTKFMKKAKLNELEKQGLIQSFEYTHELAWTTLKDFLEYQGAKDLFGSRDTTRESFRAGLVDDGEVWMDMIQSRNLTSHTYNEETMENIVGAIVGKYFQQFLKLQERLGELQTKEQK